MGAEYFRTSEYGNNPEEVFEELVRLYQLEHGRGGYTGTIAEKDGFIMFEVPEGKSIDGFIDEALSSERLEKWGPAGCIKSHETKDVAILETRGTTTSENKHEGVRKWATKYKVYDAQADVSGCATFKQEYFDKKTDALKFAKKVAFEHDAPVNIELCKILVDSKSLVATVKPKRKTVKKKQHRYIFFGWASS